MCIIYVLVKWPSPGRRVLRFIILSNIAVTSNTRTGLLESIDLLNQVCAWFFREIVREVGMRVCVYAPQAIDVNRSLNNQSNKYCF